VGSLGEGTCHLSKPPMSVIWRSTGASGPEVGIFWLIDNKLVADSIPVPQAEAYGGFYIGKNDHAAFWTTLQRILPQWNGKHTVWVRWSGRARSRRAGPPTND
jgi:hypothetical protein